MFFYIFSCLLPECRFEWGVGGNQKNDHARGSAGLRVRSEWTGVRAREFWSQSYEALFCSFAFSLGDLQHKSWRKVRLFWKNTLTWCVTTIFFRLETDCLVERPFIYWLLWSWSKSRQLWRKNSRDRKVNRQNFKFNGWWFKTGEIAPMVSSNTQHLA